MHSVGTVTQSNSESPSILWFVLKCLLYLVFNNIHLMSDPEGNSQFGFPFPEFVSGNIRTRGKTKLTGFSRDLTLSVLLYF